MLVFRYKQKKINNYPVYQLNSIGLSNKFLSWYTQIWKENNFREDKKNSKKKASSKKKI